MTYELAKQLKEAGFPQNCKDVTCYYPNSENDKQGCYAFPTLSELIGACGDIRFRLERTGISEPEKRWIAYDILTSEQGIGSSPEEAVAKLWLELNNK